MNEPIATNPSIPIVCITHGHFCTGLIGVFSSPESVEYLQRVLSGIMLHTPLQSALDPVPFRGLPCVLVNAVDHQKPEVDHLEVEKNGQRLAYR